MRLKGAEGGWVGLSEHAWFAFSLVAEVEVEGAGVSVLRLPPGLVLRSQVCRSQGMGG